MSMLIVVTHVVLWLLYVCLIVPLLGVLAWSTIKSFKEGWHYVKRLHQVPCSKCAYFTGDYRLKCTVNPCTALTEDAIDCGDYEPKSQPAYSFQKQITYVTTTTAGAPPAPAALQSQDLTDTSHSEPLPELVTSSLVEHSMTRGR